MIYYYQFDIQCHPNETVMKMYAPDWETAEQSEEYKKMLEELAPRSLRIVERQYQIHNGSKETRCATSEEIAQHTQKPKLPFERAPLPMYSYRYFGEEKVLTPLQEKLDAEYEGYTTKWQMEYEAVQGDLPLETLEEMAVVNTVYGNLKNTANCYATEYMAALSEEAHPLSRLAEAYKRAGIFAIEPPLNDMLCMIADCDGSLNHFGEFDTAYDTAGNHRERMAVLDRNLDGQISEYNGQALLSMGYSSVKERAVEIFTYRQIYQSLRFEKEKYPAEKLDVLARFKNPMVMNGWPIDGERSLNQLSLDELRELLPQMYPDITAAPDIWSSNEPQELCDEETWEYPDQENVTDIQMGGMM